MRAAKDDSGQVLVLLALSMMVLILMVGLAVDSGMAYITKAKLSKAVDAACLTGAKALPQGHPTATTLATHIFNANFGPNPPVPSITFPLDSYGDQQVNVTATAQVPTFFAQKLMQFWNVSDTAVATRGKLVMALILDRSNSMNGNGGKSALQFAVPKFVNNFSDSQDSVTMISFGSYASVDFAIGTGFQTPIKNAVSSMNFAGGTFGTGGTLVVNNGPPLAMADSQITSVIIQPGQNVTRVAIYFTDGLMNTIQDPFTCWTSSTARVTPLLNYGGYDSPNTGAHVFSPVDGTDWCPNQSTSDCVSGNPGRIAYSAAKVACQNPWGTYVTTFPSQQYGTRTISRTNVTADAQYRALQTAAIMRAETPGTYIYVIGLGCYFAAGTGNCAPQGSNPTAFLQNLANDPAGTTYNPNLPIGQFYPVPDCPTGNCNAELLTVFQTIYAKIALRLTQ